RRALRCGVDCGVGRGFGRRCGRVFLVPPEGENLFDEVERHSGPVPFCFQPVTMSAVRPWSTAAETSSPVRWPAVRPLTLTIAIWPRGACGATTGVKFSVRAVPEY